MSALEVTNDVNDTVIKSSLYNETKNQRSNSPISYISSSSEDDTSSLTTDRKSVRRTIIPPVDPNVILELEEQAKLTSRSLSKIMKYLAKNLQDTTNVTVETVHTYDSTVEHVHRDVETNIRAMYGLIAKCEELDRKMKPVTELANQVSHIKEMLNDLELMCKTS